MKIHDIIKEIELYAPKVYQESYDNSGVQVGDTTQEATGALLTLDITEEVLDEAILKNCNLIVAHHPLIFSGIKSLTGKNYIERTIIRAIQNNIVIYAAHTNLDAVHNGVNAKIAEKIGIQNLRILQPISHNPLCKFNVYVPQYHAEQVRDALFKVGGGEIGSYNECSFSIKGQGTFKPDVTASPKIGVAGGDRSTVDEIKVEVLAPKHLLPNLLQAAKNTGFYEEVAYEMIPLLNDNQTVGAGMYGTLEQAMPLSDFLHHLKSSMDLNTIKYTKSKANVRIQTVAICGGSGSFLLKDAKRVGADIFITADYKYHQFFDAEDQIVIADIGHYESERFTVEIFSDIIKRKFTKFAVYLSQTNTNPINYFI